ncbi:hypothetical protein [Spirosoma oryzicola]|uniref:hypothetical protein n=1 Tax=Spirosoma oryzicola TaxID=2898794 RepID=UPI001E3F499D|nr:hypothetical protein [Spirosoma oryzicola]UHG94674.1 hypothetical protein LQ777_29190 [Spirosoma oryzicola]
MSEIGYIYNRYELLAQTIQLFNDAVLLLKKEWLLRQADTRQKYPNLSVDPDNLALARSFVVEMLKSEAEEGELLTHLSGKPNLPSRQEIADVRAIIQQNRILQPKHFDILSRVLEILDGERSILFRKLRTST